ncbi:MAG: hypothetical protein GF401_03090 [Chitinivibrionales bacterium]|nr:hypothetical protein [Chitinivibrionales bacterium]
MISEISQFRSLNTAEMASRRSRKQDDSAGKKESKGAETKSSSSTIRNDLIQSVKSRIKKGYYNSDMVVDDLSDSFAQAFNLRI